MYVSTLLSERSEKAAVGKMKSIIRYRQAGVVIFTARLSGHGVVAGYYYASLESADLCHWQISMLKYFDWFMKIKMEMFQKKAYHLYEKVVDMDKGEHDVWTVPALLCRFCYIINRT